MTDLETKVDSEGRIILSACAVNEIMYNAPGLSFDIRSPITVEQFRRDVDLAHRRDNPDFYVSDDLFDADSYSFFDTVYSVSHGVCPVGDLACWEGEPVCGYEVEE